MVAGLAGKDAEAELRDRQQEQQNPQQLQYKRPRLADGLTSYDGGRLLGGRPEAQRRNDDFAA
jgi:hypothetical protein